MANQHINQITNPKADLEARALKEHADVVASLNSLEITIRGIILKQEKLNAATDKALKKQYKKQTKTSLKYLKTLSITLGQEIWQSVEADRKLEKYDAK